MRKPKLYLGMGFVTVLAIIFTACSGQATAPPPAPIPTPNPARSPQPKQGITVTMKDGTGRLWEVTHARDVYDMNPDYFNYGLGIGAIPSVDAPTVLDEGAPGYPDSDSRTLVFGVNHNGEQRGYSVGALSRHEVFNDIYPGESNQYVSVAY